MTADKKKFWNREDLSKQTRVHVARPVPVRADPLPNAQRIHQSVVQSRRLERSIASGKAYAADGTSESCVHCGAHESAHLWRCLACGREEGTARPAYCACGAMTATGERRCPTPIEPTPPAAS
jgi:hypothetical protein